MTSRWPGTPIFAVLAVACLAGCAGTITAANAFVPSEPRGLGAAEAWQPDVLVGLGDPATSGLDDWTPGFDVAAKAYDLDGDGVDELIAQGRDSQVYVFALSGRVLAVLPTTLPPAWHIERVLNGVEAGVLRPGESASIVITNHAAYVAAWRYDPLASTVDDFVFQRQFEVRVDACYHSPGMDAKPALGDLDGDGTLEVVVQTEETGFYALRADGSTLWKQCWGGGNSAPVIADLEGDARMEVIVGSDGGFLAVLDGATGNPLWTYSVHDAGITPGSITVSPTVADLDGVAPLEVLFTARHAPAKDPATFPDDHFALFAVHQDPVTYQAVLLWMRQPEWGNPLSATQLVVSDVDGDGRADILGMDWNTIGHVPGDWERLGPAHVFRLTNTGEDVWVREMDTWWSNQDIALVDLDGDGKLSVLVNGPAGGYDGLWRLSADTGASQGYLPLSAWKVARGPLLLDLRNDGSMQLVLAVKPTDSADERGALVVFDLDARYAAPWPGFR